MLKKTGVKIEDFIAWILTITTILLVFYICYLKITWHR